MAGIGDLQPYFDRIGYDRPGETGQATLASLLLAHMRAIPFENLDVLLRRPIELQAADLMGKLVQQRRGGYCFEHGLLFAYVLERLGFTVTLLAARVRFRVPLPVSPRLHMALMVEADSQRFLVDPGFGGPGPQIPIPIALDVPVPAPGGAFRIRERDGGELSLQREIDGEFTDLYHYTYEPQHPIDFVVANYFTGNHPLSPFVQRIMVQRPTPEGGVSIMNRQFTVRASGRVTTSEIASRSELAEILHEHFAIDLPEVETLRVPSVPEWA